MALGFHIRSLRANGWIEMEGEVTRTDGKRSSVNGYWSIHVSELETLLKQAKAAYQAMGLLEEVEATSKALEEGGEG